MTIEKVLTICISSHNKGNRCVQLVRDLLSIGDDRFDIVICDDNSNEETKIILESLTYRDVSVYYNESNLGACKNWFETINHGHGKYLLHFLDRDDINSKMISILIDLFLKQDISGGVIGEISHSILPEYTKENGLSYFVCNGKEALLYMAAIPIHPSGFFIKRAEWNEMNVKSYFYEEDRFGIYPHSHVLSLLAAKRAVMIVKERLHRYDYYGENERSSFYQGKEKVRFWWEPDSVVETFLKLIENIIGYIDTSFIEEFIILHFREMLFFATFVYKNSAESPKNMNHYGLVSREITADELYSISFMCYRRFKTNQYISKHVNPQMEDALLKETENNIKDISYKCFGKYEIERSDINRRNGEALLLNRWLHLKQNGDGFVLKLKQMGISKIAIYGDGMIGERLLREFKDSSIRVSCFVDRNAKQLSSSIPVLLPNEIDDSIDAVIVSLVGLHDQIKMELEQYTQCPIISVEKLVFEKTCW